MEQWISLVEYAQIDRKTELKKRWNDSAFVARYEPMMSGYHCDTIAEIVKRLEPNTKIVGFSDNDNPGTYYFSGDDDDGHTFAIVDGRYIVDPWMNDPEHRAVWDLEAQEDADDIVRLFGNRATWHEVNDIYRFTRDSDFA